MARESIRPVWTVVHFLIALACFRMILFGREPAWHMIHAVLGFANLGCAGAGLLPKTMQVIGEDC